MTDIVIAFRLVNEVAALWRAIADWRTAKLEARRMLIEEHRLEARRRALSSRITTVVCCSLLIATIAAVYLHYREG